MGYGGQEELRRGQTQLTFVHYGDKFFNTHMTDIHVSSTVWQFDVPVHMHLPRANTCWAGKLPGAFSVSPSTRETVLLNSHMSVHCTLHNVHLNLHVHD